MKIFGSLGKSKVVSQKIASGARTTGMRAGMAKKLSGMTKKKKY